ncbi:hypothetical protein CC80DRAFT_21866 [Byssothecium circinans]|uniref:Uncharacterized protein n=1 Tax=Byssothecium circinans TaxID=147558 RepID=A0A6A5U4L5_9PLEO|nr:hypothetical protein CC80DRAFT_21866 [Byssothecium circinans]
MLTCKGDHKIKLSNGHLPSPRELILRLVACQSHGDPHTLGCSRAFFDRLSDSFDLHQTTEEAFTNNNGAFIRYLSTDSVSKEIESHAIIIGIPQWVGGCQALSQRFNVEARTIRVFLHYISDKGYIDLLEYLHSVPDKTAYRHPLLLPAYLLRYHRRQIEAYRHEVDQSILKIEHRIGYAVPGTLHGVEQWRSRMLERSGLENIVRRLHASKTELGAVSLEAGFGKSLGAFLANTELELESSILKGRLDLLKISEALVHVIDFNTNLYSTMRSQTAVLNDRVSTQINLTFSIIAQEENKLSRTVAENSKRDSAAMKTIAIVTLFFLPPTFVATLFSMSMFNWDSEEPGTKLSSYFWVYWAVAAPLTLAVWLIWRVWWRTEEKRLAKELPHQSWRDRDSSEVIHSAVSEISV